MYRNSYIEINLDNIKYNIEVLSKAGKKIIGVVKANGYGIIDYVEVETLKEAGVDFFAVSSLDEAIRLRKHSFDDEILILGYVPIESLDIVKVNRFSIVTISKDYLEKANLDGIKVHIKIDTGMNRIGVEPDETAEVLDLLINKNAKVEGIMSHLSSADDDLEYTNKQYSLFKECVEKLNYDFKYIHIAATDGAMILKDDICNCRRIGIGMLGYSSHKNNLKPSVSLFSEVIMCKKLQEGETVSYGRHYTSDGHGYILTIPIGYADGFYRANTGKQVYVDGEYGTIVGSVCMDQLMILTENPHLPGTLVELFGDHISIEQRAKELGTITYELITSLSERLSRKYIKNNKVLNNIDSRF